MTAEHELVGRQAAKRLFISRRTAESHLDHILAATAPDAAVAEQVVDGIEGQGSDSQALEVASVPPPSGPAQRLERARMLSGRFEDSGTSAASPTVTPIANSNHGRLSGDQQFVGQEGTIFTHCEGIAFPNNSPHAVGEGRFRILSGTGAYAGVSGRGSSLVVVDAISNQFIGTEVGTVET